MSSPTEPNKSVTTACLIVSSSVGLLPKNLCNLVTSELVILVLIISLAASSAVKVPSLNFLTTDIELAS